MLKQKNHSRKTIISKIFSGALAIIFIGTVFLPMGAAEAETKSKWQKLLEKNNVDRALWEKYLPNVSQDEYKKVTGKTVQSKGKSKVTKWQTMLERNGVDPALWSKYLPKVSRTEYRKAVKAQQGSAGGPEIRIGLFKLFSDNQKKVKFKGSTAFEIKNESGVVVRTVAAGEAVTLKADLNDKNFVVLGADGLYTYIGQSLTLVSPDANNVFEIPGCDANTSEVKKTSPSGCYTSGSVEYSKYRGKMELNFDKNDEAWVINCLPVEHYNWGTGEISSALSDNYLKMFSVIFRTYGYYYIQNRKGTHKDQNFNLSDTANDQIYKGYVIEERIPHMKEAAQKTRGEIVTYKGDPAVTAYCSYTDGKTRDGGFPHLKSVKDPYGKHPSKSTAELKDEGNHMMGLSANGARGYIDKKKKSYTWVLKYYYKNTKVAKAY